MTDEKAKNEPEILGLWFLLYCEAGTSWNVHAEPFPTLERAEFVGRRWKDTLGDRTRVKIVKCLCLQKDEFELV
jgi:hypothetical protein